MTRAAPFLEPSVHFPQRKHQPNATREMLLYGSMHAPSSCVEALCVFRLSEHWQVMATALSNAPRFPIVPLGRWLGIIPPNRSGSESASTKGPIGPPGVTNLLLTLQHQSSRTMTEYTYSLDDALWGARILRHICSVADGATLSAGGELFFSIAEKSGGSTCIALLTYH